VVIAVQRPGAAQAELRVGHAGPGRNTPDYYALVTLNALLGGQFTSRINQQLRERLAVTYGARSAFDMRRAGGLFSVDTSIQSDAAHVGVREILRELRDVSAPGAITSAELAHARAGLTRGYVRHFETASQIARALVEMVTYDLADDVFDRFVPSVSHLSVEDISLAARDALRPDQASVVVVTDLDVHGAALQALGLPVVQAAPEF
jgi:predicted Zn-dependent peptidase